MSDWYILRLWRNWIRPVVFGFYALILLIALPLCIKQLHKHDAPANVEAWFYGGLFVMMCLPISLYAIMMHCIHYTKPHLQKPIVRILWMVPIYALNSWFALLFDSAAIYLDTLRECYEAYVVYSFMTYILNFLHDTYPNFHELMADKPWNKLIFPCCCCPPWASGTIFISRCKHGVLQYTVVRPITTIIALICETAGVYNEGVFDFSAAWPYLTFVNNLSQFWAMYCLILFYTVTKAELQPLKPISKFACVKAVVFFSFWQAVLISILANTGVITNVEAWKLYSPKAIVHGLQNFLICIEMFIASIAHYFSFSHEPFIDHTAPQRSWVGAFRSMWDVSDVSRDVAEHVRVVGKGISRRVPGRSQRTGMDDGQSTSERMPLLTEEMNDFYDLSTDRDKLITVDVDVHASIGSLSHSPDASYSQYNIRRPSFSDSMNNLIKFDRSMDAQEQRPRNESNRSLDAQEQRPRNESNRSLDAQEQRPRNESNRSLDAQEQRPRNESGGSLKLSHDLKI